jgi:hypothetical protein
MPIRAERLRVVGLRRPASMKGQDSEARDFCACLFYADSPRPAPSVYDLIGARSIPTVQPIRRQSATLRHSRREFVHSIAVVRDLRTRRTPYARANLLFIAPEARGVTDGMGDKTSFVVVHSIMSRMDGARKAAESLRLRD